MQRTASFRDERDQVPGIKFIAFYTLLVLALLVVDVAGYGLVALTA